MKKTLTNIDLFQRTAKKIGLTFKKTPIEGNPNLFCISGNGKFYFGSSKAPGFYPEARRWGAHLTGNKMLTQETLTELGYKTVKSSFLKPQNFASFKDFFAKAKKDYCKFPVILKPNKGLDGRGIKYIAELSSLKHEMRKFYKRKITVVMQQILMEPEYRILVVNNKVEIVHSKDFRAVIGDGTKTIAALLKETPDKDKNEEFIKLQYNLTKTTKRSVLPKNTEFTYHIVKNSSDRHWQTSRFPKELTNWATELTKTLNIPTLGIDLFIAGDLHDSDTYTIIELNSNPGLSHYYSSRANTEQPERIAEKVLRSYFKLKN